MKITIDKIYHFDACAIVAIVTALLVWISGAQFLSCFVGGTLAGAACGLGKEYGDKCAPDNKWSWEDVIADIVGAVFGGIVGAILTL